MLDLEAKDRGIVSRSCFYSFTCFFSYEKLENTFV